MNNAPPPSEKSTAPPVRRSGRAWRIGLSLVPAALILLTIGLATPQGQRWAVHRALEVATAALGGADEGLAISLEGVHIGWRPLGIALDGLALHDTRSEADREEADRGGDSSAVHAVASPPPPLLRLRQLTLLPGDRTGRHWKSVELDGLHIAATGLDHLLSWFAGDTTASDSAAALPLRLDHIALSDITLEHDAGSVGHFLLALDRLQVEGGQMRDGQWTWDTMEGQASVATARMGQRDTTLLHWTGQGSAAQINCSGQPEFWLSSAEGAEDLTEWIPGEWALALDWSDSRAQLVAAGERRGNALEFTIALDRDSLVLHAAEARYTWKGGTAYGIPTTGTLAVRGPLAVPLSGLGQRPGAGPWSGGLSLDWSGGLAAGAAPRVTVEWDARTGDGTCSGDWPLPTEKVPTPTTVNWALHGRLPTVDDWLSASAWQADLAGPVTVERAGNATGSGRLEGDLSVEGGRNGEGQWTWGSKWSPRSAPLTLTEGLELYGQWDWELDATLSPDGAVTEWWTHINLGEGRFIPLAGFDGRTTPGAPLALRRFHLAARGDAEQFALDLTGDLLQGHVHGPLRPEAWWNPLVDLMASGDLLPPEAARGWMWEDHGRAPAPWEADLTVWRSDLLERFSHESWSVGKGSTLQARYDTGQVSLTLDLPQLHIGPFRGYGIAFGSSGGAIPLAASLQADSLTHKQYGALQDVHVGAAVDLGAQSVLEGRWTGAVPTAFTVAHQLEDDGSHTLFPSDISVQYKNAHWTLDPSPGPRLQWQGHDWRTLRADGLHILGNQGSLRVASTATDRNGPLDTLDLAEAGLEVQLDAFPAGPWLDLISRSQDEAVQWPAADGLLHGAVTIRYAPFSLQGNLQWEDAKMDDFALGDLCLTSQWNEAQFHVLEQFKDDRRILLAASTDLETVEVELEAWPLDLLQPLLSPADVAVVGQADGWLRLHLDAPDRAPTLQGRLDVVAPYLGIGATGVQYQLDGVLDIGEELIAMDRARMTDREGNSALLNLSVVHDGFADWNYDIGLDLAVPILVMDLPPDPGRLYHGQVWATGQANVFGTTEYMEVEASARSAAGTRFTMPLDALEGPEMPSGITIAGGDATAGTVPAGAAPFDLSLALEVEVTPEAALSMVLDQRAGERVDGHASGTLSFVRNRSRSLAMEGGLAIQKGAYRFSLRDLFTKTIAIAPNGRIDWDGDPYAAELNLMAVDAVKASPAVLLPGMVDRGKTEVEVGMGITGALESPELSFSIAFPTYAQVNPNMLAQVNAALSTPEEIERQAFALLAAGQFIPPDQQDVQLIERTVAAQATDLVSSGVSDLLSSLSEDVEIGLRYIPSTGAGNAPGTDVAGGAGPIRTEDAFQMDLGLNLLNDRLRISGSLGAQGVEGFSLEQDDLQGAFDVRYQLTADGRWEIMGFRRPESQLDEAPKQGIGAVFQVRFDRLGDLFRKDPERD